MSNAIHFTKLAASAIVGAGTTTIVGSIIKNNTNPETTSQKVQVTSAAVVIGMMAADKTKEYTNAKIDAAVAWYADLKTNLSNEK